MRDINGMNGRMTILIDKEDWDNFLSGDGRMIMQRLRKRYENTTWQGRVLESIEHDIVINYQYCNDIVTVVKATIREQLDVDPDTLQWD